MGVPAGFARDMVATHRAVATEKVLYRAREYVVNPRLTVRRRRALEENEFRLALRLRERLVEQLLLAPTRQDFLLEIIR